MACRGSDVGANRFFSLTVPIALLLFVARAEAIVSYCNDITPHSYSYPESETICEREGEYIFKNVIDKSTQKMLYDDLGTSNTNRRYSSMDLSDNIVAKYANTSGYVMHIRVLNTSIVPSHHCCQVCQNDCEQFRYTCPRKNVLGNDSCTADPSQFPTCRFSEDVLRINAQLICAVKVSESRRIPDYWFASKGFVLQTSARNCPYRDLKNGSQYLIMATASTPTYGAEDTLTGADMIINLPKQKLSPSYLKGMNFKLRGYAYLKTINGTCPTESSIRATGAGEVLRANGLLLISFGIASYFLASINS